MKVIKVFIISAALITSLFFFTPSQTYACSCLAERSVEHELSASRAVFEGTVTSISSTPTGEHLVSFNVSQYWKGDIKPTATVATAQNSAACGYAFDKNESYLVYANSPEDLTQLNVSLCGRTKLMYDAKDDIKELGSGMIPTDTTAPTDVLVEKQLNWVEKIIEWFINLLNR